MVSDEGALLFDVECAQLPAGLDVRSIELIGVMHDSGNTRGAVTAVYHVEAARGTEGKGE
jgi:hypothetical protein